MGDDPSEFITSGGSMRWTCKLADGEHVIVSGEQNVCKS